MAERWSGDMIAHSMERLPPYYTATLVENLHSYVDRIIELIITTSSENPELRTENSEKPFLIETIK